MLCVFRSASHGSGAHFLKGFGCYLGVIALLVGLAFSGADLWLESGEWLQFAIAVWTGVQSSGAAPSTADGQRSGSLVDWSKLISKPNVFDNKSAEEDMRSFRDWHWMLRQYLTAIDQGFAAELKQLDDDPSKPPRVDNSVSRDASEIQQVV